jgi:DNA-binding Lrp family transcriptional regulator
VDTQALPLTFTEQRLLDEFQHGFPLEPRPYAHIAQQLGISEAAVLDSLQRLQAQGAVSRVGPVLQPNRIGASTLAALAVPAAQLEQIAALVSEYPEVNHNYQREHHYNLWFVVTAPDRARLDTILADITARSGFEVLDLPMLEDYFIDLGFRLQWT